MAGSIPDFEILFDPKYIAGPYKGSDEKKIIDALKEIGFVWTEKGSTPKYGKNVRRIKFESNRRIDGKSPVMTELKEQNKNEQTIHDEKLSTVRAGKGCPQRRRNQIR